MPNALKLLFSVLLLSPCVVMGAGPPGIGDWYVIGEPILIDEPPVRIDPEDPGTGGEGTIVIEDPPGTPGIFGCHAQRIGLSFVPLPNSIGEPIDRIQPRAWLPDTTGSTVSIVDTGDYKFVDALEVGSSPHGVAIDPLGTFVYIGNRDSADISVIDTLVPEVVATLPLDGQPAGLAVSHDGKVLMVALEDSYAIVLIDTATRQELQRIILEHPPYHLTSHPDGKSLVVLSRIDAILMIVDPAGDGMTTSIDLGNDLRLPVAMAVSPDGKHIHVILNGNAAPRSRLAVIDLDTGTVDQQAAEFDDPMLDITWHTDGSRYFLLPESGSSCVHVLEVDAGNNSIVGTHMFPGNPVRGLHDGQTLHALSMTEAALLGRSNFDPEQIPPRFLVAETTGSPGALGNFIAPALAPTLALENNPVDFGELDIGESTIRAVVVTNTGTLPLKIYQAEIAKTTFVSCVLGGSCLETDSGLDAYSIMDDGCSGGEIATGSSCMISVRYAPHLHLHRNASLQLHTNASTTASSVALVGATIPGNDSGADNSGDTDNTDNTGDTAAVTTETGIEGAAGAYGWIELLLLMLVTMLLISEGRRNRRRHCRAADTHDVCLDTPAVNTIRIASSTPRAIGCTRDFGR